MADYYTNNNNPYGGSQQYASYGSPAAPEAILRRRQPTYDPYSSPATANNNNGTAKTSHSATPYSKATLQKLDILFPKVDREFTVQTRSGGMVSLVATIAIALLCLAEILSWASQHGSNATSTVVDQSLGRHMRVNLNITFPALACEDLHVDVIDVAGDSQLNIEDTLKKKKLHVDGHILSHKEIEVLTNQHKKVQSERERVLESDIPDDYCGPCYGAQETEDQCCQTCGDVSMAYVKKRWKTDLLKYTAEQCIREGKGKEEPKRMTKGQGCNLSGYMTLGRVNGNFHIAMGLGVERDGRHIHTYLPEDAPNFNASHVIHQLSFGPEDGTEALNGVTKIVTTDTGTTGLFQYFIKVVPTTFVGEDAFPKIKAGDDLLPGSLYSEVVDAKGNKEKTLETNRYFFSERFMPLMTKYVTEEHRDEEDKNKAHVQAGHGGHHTDQQHHEQQNAVLPGVFFIYEIYPFAVKILFSTTARVGDQQTIRSGM